MASNSNERMLFNRQRQEFIDEEIAKLKQSIIDLDNNLTNTIHNVAYQNRMHGSASKYYTGNIDDLKLLDGTYWVKSDTASGNKPFNYIDTASEFVLKVYTFSNSDAAPLSLQNAIRFSSTGRSDNRTRIFVNGKWGAWSTSVGEADLSGTQYNTITDLLLSVYNRSLSTAYQNPLTDALSVDTTNSYALKNRPSTVDAKTTTTNMPTDCKFGVREVFWRSTNNLVVQITGVDKNDLGRTWVNALHYEELSDGTTSFGWSGWKDYITDLNKEISDRKAADTTITNNLNKEISDRKAADTTITNNLNKEISDRTSGDNNLNNTKVNKAGDTMTGTLKSTAGTQLDADNKGNPVTQLRLKSQNGYFEYGLNGQNKLYIDYYYTGSGGVPYFTPIVDFSEAGQTTFAELVNAPKGFVGDLAGNATSALKLTTKPDNYRTGAHKPSEYEIGMYVFHSGPINANDGTRFDYELEAEILTIKTSSTAVVQYLFPTIKTSGDISTKNIKFRISNGSAQDTWGSWRTYSFSDHLHDDRYLRLSGGTVNGTVTATKFSGPLTGNVTGDVSGNAGTATTLKTARTFKVGDTSKSFNGSANVAWTPTEIGYKHEWTATIKGATWSRLCYIGYNTGVVGSSFILQIGATRNSVVYNDTFAITVHHSSVSTITKISGSKYGTFPKIRTLVNASGDCYVELYDTANSITNTTTQAVYCRLLPISTGATITKYTAFTDGTTVPTDYKVARELQCNTNDLQGSLSGDVTGNASSATKLATARKIGNADFNGTANITLDQIGASPKAGSTSLNQLASTIRLGAGNSGALYQNGETYHQKFDIIDNSTNGDAVFKFSQSADAGSTFKNLMEIRDDGNVVATKFTGALTGNVTGNVSGSATKLATARKIGNANFDGTANITLDQIGALPAAGGTITGPIKYKGYSIVEGFTAGTETTGYGAMLGAVGGTTIIGSGESATVMKNAVTNSAAETMYITSDNGINFYTHMQDSYDSRKEMVFGADGVLTVPTVKGNLTGNVTGNAATATTATKANQLTTARKIGSASFDGTADITLAQIGAAAASHTHSYLPLSGGTLTGNLVTPSMTANGDITFGNSGTAFRGVIGAMAGSDKWRVGGAGTGDNAGYMEIATSDDANEPIYVRQYNGYWTTVKRTATLLDGSGNTSFPGSVQVGGGPKLQYDSANQCLNFVF